MMTIVRLRDLLLCALLIAGAPAAAQQATDDVGEPEPAVSALSAYEQGVAALDANDVVAAIANFERAILLYEQAGESAHVDALARAHAMNFIAGLRSRTTAVTRSNYYRGQLKKARMALRRQYGAASRELFDFEMMMCELVPCTRVNYDSPTRPSYLVPLSIARRIDDIDDASRGRAALVAARGLMRSRQFPQAQTHVAMAVAALENDDAFVRALILQVQLHEVTGDRESAGRVSQRIGEIVKIGAAEDMVPIYQTPVSWRPLTGPRYDGQRVPVVCEVDAKGRVVSVLLPGEAELSEESRLRAREVALAMRFVPAMRDGAFIAMSGVRTEVVIKAPWEPLTLPFP